ncbi:MAG: hydrogenase maturation nickel metallochaperone HypA [Bacteroidia bacterium]|nr:hydrogenase maturation nickel metallochaperone HypA [Bacteroidia bacterium]
MHELAVIEGIIETMTKVAEANRLSRISQVDLVIGKLHQLVPDMLEFAFETGTQGTMAEKCKLVIEWRPVFVTCRDCLMRSEIIDSIFICPHCGSFRLNTESGKELYIKSITGE